MTTSNLDDAMINAAARALVRAVVGPMDFSRTQAAHAAVDAAIVSSGGKVVIEGRVFYRGDVTADVSIAVIEATYQLVIETVLPKLPLEGRAEAEQIILDDCTAVTRDMCDRLCRVAAKYGRPHRLN